MQSGHTNFSIAKPIFSTHQIAGIRGHAARRCVPCSPPTIAVDPALTRQITPPSTLHTLRNILHRAASAVPAVLQSRPRPLRLARSVSSRAFFVAFPLPTCRGVPTLVPHTFTPEIRKKPFSARNLWTLPISILTAKQYHASGVRKVLFLRRSLCSSGAICL